MRMCFIITVMALAIGYAAAHDHGPGSWINQQNLRDPVTGEYCCNLNDCAEESADNIEAREGGYFIKSTGELIETARVIWKSPGGWWRCRYLDFTGRTRCLIGPPPSG